MITLYDIIAKAPIKTWSPYAWRARYVLNLKQLPYKSLWIEYPDVASAHIEAGIPPLLIKPDGSPHYTCPAIFDDMTGVGVPGSFKVAQYLDERYPDTPKAIPLGSEGLQAAFEDQFEESLDPIWVLIVPKVTPFLNPNSAKYFYDTRSVLLGKPLEQLGVDPEERKELWAKAKVSFDKLDAWYSKSSGPFVMGETVSFADFIVAGMLQTIRICLGPENQEWKAIEQWNNGRWKALVNSLEKFAGQEN